MINVITEHGASFKGLAAYLLHDVDQESSDRVAWTETHGLATDDPERAWRIMTATAKSQADLKAEAGVANTGRKSHKHVMHYVLSWHPEEREELTRDEMLSAATASMMGAAAFKNGARSLSARVNSAARASGARSARTWTLTSGMGDKAHFDLRKMSRPTRRSSNQTATTAMRM